MTRKRIRLLSEAHREEHLPLTPLMDIIFLVTIFFVLTAGAALNTSLEVDVPTALTATPGLENALVVTIRSPDSVDVNGTQTTMEGLKEVLLLALQNGSAATVNSVTLVGNRNISYGFLVQVMDLLRTLGLHRIALVTQDPE